MGDVAIDVLAAGDRHRLAGALTRRRWSDGAVVFREGDDADALYVIVSGIAAVEVLSRDGDVVTLALLGAGNCFGELSLFGHEQTRSATVRVVGSLEAIVLERHDVERLRAEHRGVDRFLLEVLAEQVRHLSTLVVEAHHSTAEARIVHRLAAAAHLFARAGEPTVVRLTQEQLASMAGATRPTTNRVLGALEADGIVARRHAAVEILDSARLTDHARSLG